MVPLSELGTLAQDCTPEDVERAVASTGFSRFPLVADQADIRDSELNYRILIPGENLVTH